MQLYNVTIAVTYECRGTDNTLYEQSSMLYLIVEGDSSDDDYSSEIEAEIEANRPVNCAGQPIYSYTVESSDVSDNQGQELTPDELSQPIPPEDIGQLVTFEGLAYFACPDGSFLVRTVQADLFSTATVGEVMQALEDRANELGDQGADRSPCKFDHVEITGPTYFWFQRD